MGSAGKGVKQFLFHTIRLKSGESPVKVQLKSGRNPLTWWTFRGVRGDREGGGSVFIENPRRGGVSQEEVGGARGLGGCL